ncbi:beta-fructofuranosidase, soluble isoenzyme I-like [Andrographis paniculata]|uniref:beta-fructofuranosidase, soluble isoenzyme I-like n=1 Tax=Andrographis paniculata TaxID=175694 RepID=UPI0021E99A74|nr:beta-fructofuranosidase, soluble isoenzyme I-like [Andrographis paniculata]
MAPSHAPPQDLERAAGYAPIPGGPEAEQPKPRKLLRFTPILFFLSISAILLTLKITKDPSRSNNLKNSTASFSPATPLAEAPSRGPAQGVSEKVFRSVAGGNSSFRWTNAMLTWQRTAFHFQPEKNWMNDPNGPLFHKGWYHLFYQYNPESAVWGNIVWGHAVSRDLVHWLHLPFAMVPDQWYDINGVWTGSATLLPDGRIVMLYTGDTADLVQVQCLAHPANVSDPLLLEWVKDPANPVLLPPPGIKNDDFRDPTTAWLAPDGHAWRITIGSKVNKTGVSIVYETRDFVEYKLLDGYLHQVPGTGMWECIDFYPVSLTGVNGLDTSANGAGIKHVMKTSLDDDKNDYYAIGTYDPIRNVWTPDDPENDVGTGLRYDYGKYYASKTFYDQDKKRRILWGWIRETDAEVVDVMKGWSGVQCIPRSVVFDQKTGRNILQWPVEEVESLRSESFEFKDVRLGPGSITPVTIETMSQLDIEATFEIEKDDEIEAAIENNDGYACPTSGGAATRGVFGPFGIIVLADKALSELTPVYFYVSKGSNGKTTAHFCADELRSSKALEVQKIVYGSDVPVLDGEKFSMRLLVDHSIVESFAQGGRRVITSRIYPTNAIGNASRVYLFNNATRARVTASIKVWKMKSAEIQRFPFDKI